MLSLWFYFVLRCSWEWWTAVWRFISPRFINVASRAAGRVREDCTISSPSFHLLLLDPPLSLLTFKSAAGIQRSCDRRPIGFGLFKAMPDSHGRLVLSLKTETEMGFMISLPQRILFHFRYLIGILGKMDSIKWVFFFFARLQGLNV